MSVIQVVRFHLRSEVVETDFLTVNEQFQREAMAILPGLERREACRGPDGAWMLVLRYRDAEAARPRAAPHELGAKLMSMIDRATMSSALYEVVSG